MLLTPNKQFKKFWEGGNNLEHEKHSGRPSEGDNDQLRAVIKDDPLTSTWEVAEELNANHSMVVRHLKQIGKVKRLGKWMSHKLTPKKNSVPEAVVVVV